MGGMRYAAGRRKGRVRNERARRGWAQFLAEAYQGIATQSNGGLPQAGPQAGPQALGMEGQGRLPAQRSMPSNSEGGVDAPVLCAGMGRRRLVGER